MSVASAAEAALWWHRAGDDEAAAQAVPLNLQQSNFGFTERRPVVFFLDQNACEDGEGHGYRLFIDDEPLATVDDAPNRWEWQPGFYAGEVRAELVDGFGRSLGVWRLDISPDPGKAGREVYESMLSEIIDFDATLVLGEEPARHRLGAMGDTNNPLVLFDRLRRRRDTLERSLAAIRANPASVLRSRRRFVPLRAVRRADLRTLRAAMRQPGTLAAIRGNSHGVSEGREPLFDVPAVERRLDSPANRAALFMLRALLLRCRDLRQWIGELAKKERGETRISLYKTRTSLYKRNPRWQEILDQIEKSLMAVERLRPFSEVKRPELTAAGLNAVAAHPLYARFWRVGWEALRRGVSRWQPEDALPMAPTWEIYERWCFVALAQMLQVFSGSDYKWKTRGSSEKPEFVGRCGDGHEITLSLQKTASSSNGVKQEGLWSVSRQCQPDLVLQWRRPGQETAFAVLDAKYRSTREGILPGMAESAHLYQDALRWGSRRPEFTLLLTPGAERVDWLTHEDFIREHHVGVVVLLPDAESPAWFCDLLTETLQTGTAVASAPSLAAKALKKD